MMALFNIVQGVISTIMNAAGFGTAALAKEIREECEVSCRA